MAWSAGEKEETAPEQQALRRRNRVTALLLGVFALSCYAAYFLFR